MKKYLAIIALLTSTACVPVAIGAAGAGGYYAAKDTRDVRTIASDATITAEINAKYVRDDLVSVVNIDVDTRNGEVMLIGSVNSEAAKSRAIGIAEATKGVVSVNAEHLKVVE
ncbi:MAG: periplasmic protein [Rickettsiaceae bacterium]|jgi:hyperosmotically inducible protein|nr:periplasmic protein [Rickettsiaceae bacterium]